MKKTMKSKILLTSILPIAVIVLPISLITSCSSTNNNTSNNPDNNDNVSQTIENIKKDLLNFNLVFDDVNKITKEYLDINVLKVIQDKYNTFNIVLDSFEIIESQNLIQLNLSINNKVFNSKYEIFQASVNYQIKASTISFKSSNEFNFGDSTLYVKDNSITEQYLKNKIIENINEIVYIPNSSYNKDFFDANLQISKYLKNNSQGFVTIKVKINNIPNINPNYIENNIVISGFKLFDENSIILPEVKIPNQPTEEELNKEVEYWTNTMELDLLQKNFTNDEINNLTSDELYSLLTDSRTDNTPIQFYDDSRGFNYDIKENITHTTNTITFTISISIFINQNIVTKEVVKNVSYQQYNGPNSDLFEKIAQKVKLVPKNENYKNISAKSFINLDPFKIKDYFDINKEKLYKEFWMEPGFEKISNTFIIQKDSYNFKKPQELTFEVNTNYTQSNLSQKSSQKIIGFKNIETIGKLDIQPFNELLTPNNAVSYKGELEKFLISDINSTSQTNYESLLNQVTWDEVKHEIMYQARFYLYQMFSDNFKEINYYILNEQKETKFTAIAEGIIDKDQNNHFYGFQVNIGTQNHNAKSNLKSGDLVRIKLDFDTNSNNHNWRPSLIDYGDIFGDFTYSWFWNFDNNCYSLQDKNNKYYVEDLPRNNWSAINYYEVSVNGNKTISSNVQQYNSYWFSKLFKIPKKN